MPNHNCGKKVPEILANSGLYLSRWAAYPYNQVTAVDVGYTSGSGMEYPMITAIGTEGYAFGLEDVIVHEVAQLVLREFLDRTSDCIPGWMKGSTCF